MGHFAAEVHESILNVSYRTWKSYVQSPTLVIVHSIDKENITLG